MLNTNQDRILDLFRKNVFLKTSIFQIMRKLNKKAYQRIYDGVKALEKENILLSEKVGNSNIIQLLLTSQAIRYLSFQEEQEATNKRIPNYEKIVSMKEISQYLIIVTGSYAKNVARKESDLDLVIITSNHEKAIKLQKLIENLTLLFYPRIHLYVINNKDFVEMLLSKEENYGKEIFRHHLILKNAYIYYELLKEAIENGFKG